MLTAEAQTSAIRAPISGPVAVVHRGGYAEPRLSIAASPRGQESGALSSETTPLAGTPPHCIAAFRVELEYVQRTLRRLGTNRSEVDDLAQEVFLVLHRRWHAYDPSRPLRPYLFGIAFRLALAHQRRRNREVAFGLFDVGDDGPGPEDTLCAKQTRALLQAALKRIPMPRRAVLVMHELDQVPVNEVAVTLSIPLFTAYSRLRKARQELEAATRRLMNAPGERGQRIRPLPR